MSRDGKQADIKEHLANALPRPLGFRTNAMTRTIFRNSFTTSLEVPSYYKIIVGIVKILIYYMPVLGNQCRICNEKIKYYQIDEHAIIHILITLRQKLISPYVECRPSSNSFCHDIKKKKGTIENPKKSWEEGNDERKLRIEFAGRANGLVYMCLRGNGKGNRCGCFANETIVSYKRAREAGKG